MDSGPDLFSENSEILPQINIVAELFHGSLPIQDFCACCGLERLLQQPSAQGFFAGSGSRNVQELEKRAFSEDIEVSGIGMGFVFDRNLRVVAANPTVLDSGQASLVECYRSHRAPRTRQYLFVIGNQSDEDGNRQQQ